MRYFFLTVSFMLSVTIGAFAAGDAGKCQGKYPVVLAHGMGGCEDMLEFFDYWYGVEEALREEGAEVCTVRINCMDSTEAKAKQLRDQVMFYLATLEGRTDVDNTKIHYIGHSHGTIYGRYAISLLSAIQRSAEQVAYDQENPSETLKNQLIDYDADYIGEKGNAYDFTYIGHHHENAIKPFSDYIATYTSVSGVHKGSSGPDLVLEMCQLADKVIPGPEGKGEIMFGDFINFIYGIIGDTPGANSAQNCYDLSTDYMQNVFNKAVINVDGIYYQSYVSWIKRMAPQHLGFAFLWPAIYNREGDNDGCVSVDSASWGEVHKVNGAFWAAGVDHLNIIGHWYGFTPGYDAPSTFVDMVADLRNHE